MKPVRTPQKPWRQLAFVLGEAALTLVSNGALFIVISRVGGPELLGTYALAFAWLMLFQGISSFGIPEFLMREVGVHGRLAASSVFHAMLLGLGSGFVALWLMLGAVRLLGYSPQIVDVISVASLALIPASLNTASRSVFLALREMQLTFVALLAEVTIVMSASLFLLFSGYGAIALMVSLVVGKLASGSTSLFLLYARVLPGRPSFDPVLLVRTARTVFSFGVGNMLGMLTMRINTIMVSVWVDIAAVGHFAAATKIMEICLIVPNLFVQLLMTRMAHSFNTQGHNTQNNNTQANHRDPNRFASWYRLLFAIVLPTCVGVWVFAGLILEILFGPGFDNAVWVLRILMIYLAIESADAVMSVILKAAHMQRQDVSRLAFNPLTNILLNLALLPTLGMVGAAIGRVGGVGASATLRSLLIARKLAPLNWVSFARKSALIGVGVASVCYALHGAAGPGWLALFYVAATASLLGISSSVSRSAIKDIMSTPASQD